MNAQIGNNDDTLINKKCVPCHGGVSALSADEARKKTAPVVGVRSASRVAYGRRSARRSERPSADG